MNGGCLVFKMIVNADAGGIAHTEADRRTRNASVHRDGADRTEIAGSPFLLGNVKVVFDETGMKAGAKQQKDENGEYPNKT